MTTLLLPLLAAPLIGGALALLAARIVAALASPAGAVGTEELARDASASPPTAWPIAGVFRDYGAVMLGCLAVAAVAVLTESDPVFGWIGCGLGWTLVALAWIDWHHLVLPDILTLPLLLAGLGTTLWLDPQAAPEHAVAAAFGYAAFRAIEAGYRRLRGADGLGRGDAKLLAAAGAWLGLVPLPTVVFVAAGCGLLMAAALRLAGRELGRDTPLPFGPALCAGIFATWLGFDPILVLAEYLT
jgi:leader peptidase (prepilin peptidase)/N-methyltransferase